MNPAGRYEDALKAVATQAAYGTYNGRGICYDTRLRYVNLNGVRYWEHGAFDLLAAGIRNPDGRKWMSKQLGTACVKSDEYKGKLFTPEGLEVRKSQLVDNPVLWIDQEHEMVVNATYYESLKYACESSPPIPRNRLKVAFPDKKADKEKWPEIKQWIDWVDAQRNLGGDEPLRVSAYKWDRMLRDFASAPAQPKGELFSILWRYEGSGVAVRRHFLKQNQIIREYPWLKTTKPA